MKIVYIAHPIAADEKFTTDENVADLLRILRIINLEQYSNSKFESNPEISWDTIIPIAPYLGDVLSMDDTVVFQRKRGLQNCEELINTGMFDELWLTGHKLSFGMQAEVNMFKLLGKPIINLIGKI
jgi:hypothetical protein